LEEEKMVKQEEWLKLLARIKAMAQAPRPQGLASSSWQQPDSPKPDLKSPY
jgi:hypothetical protein